MNRFEYRDNNSIWQSLDNYEIHICFQYWCYLVALFSAIHRLSLVAVLIYFVFYLWNVQCDGLSLIRCLARDLLCEARRRLLTLPGQLS